MLKYNSKGIQPIIPGVNNIQGVNVPLVTFDSLMDTDFGLMLYIDKYKLDPTVFDVSFFDSHHTIRSMLKALMERENPNPLWLCMNKNLEACQSIADELYTEFMETESFYEDIIGLSMYTNLCDFIRLSESSGKEVRATILCRTEFEKDFVKKRISKSTPVALYDDFINKKNEYQQFFFKHLYDQYICGDKMHKIINVIGNDKSIYLANYKFDDIDNVKNSEFMEAMALRYNRIKIYDLYKREIFEEEENNDDN